MSLLEKIRNAYYGKPIIYNPGIREAIHEMPVEESKPAVPAAQSTAAPTDPKQRTISKIMEPPINNQAPANGESVVSDERTFLENLEAIEEEYFGLERSRDLNLKRDPFGNVCTDDLSFEQKLEAASAEYLGRGSGPGEMNLNNVTNDAASFEENFAAVNHAYLGIGSGKIEVVAENVTDENKSFGENFSAIMDNYGDIRPRQQSEIIKGKKSVVPKRIKGINC